MRLAVCILHYGNAAMTGTLHKQFVEGNAAHDRDIYVLDNNSPTPYPGAFERLPGNLFWGGALAYAVDLFADRGYTHLWFCNNDIFFLSAPPYYSNLLKVYPRTRFASTKKGLSCIHSPK